MQNSIRKILAVVIRKIRKGKIKKGKRRSKKIERGKRKER